MEFNSLLIKNKIKNTKNKKNKHNFFLKENVAKNL
jgi:hypothetical protein